MLYNKSATPERAEGKWHEQVHDKSATDPRYIELIEFVLVNKRSGRESYLYTTMHSFTVSETKLMECW